MAIQFDVDAILMIVRNKRVQQERHIAHIPESTETAYASTKAKALNKLAHHMFSIPKDAQTPYRAGTGSWLDRSQYIYWDVAENGNATKKTVVVKR